MRVWQIAFVLCAVVLGVSLAVVSSASNAVPAADDSGAPAVTGATGSQAEVKPVASPQAAPVKAAPIPDLPLTPQEERTLRYEFGRAQGGERRALEHRQRSEMTELKLSQDARLKEWQTKETEARKLYFQSHNGVEKRAYMRELQGRRKSLVQVLSEQKSQRSREQDARFKSVVEDQKAKLKEFQDALKAHKRPPQRLWPVANP